MKKRAFINIGIKSVGWFCVFNSIFALLHILSLFAYSKEGLDQLNESGGIPSVVIPVLSVFYFFIGQGILKKQHWARLGFITFSLVGIFIGIPIRIYETSYPTEDIILTGLVVIGTLFLLLPRVKDCFTYELHPKNVEVLPGLGDTFGGKYVKTNT